MACVRDHTRRGSCAGGATRLDVALVDGKDNRWEDLREGRVALSLGGAAARRRGRALSRHKTKPQETAQRERGEGAVPSHQDGEKAVGRAVLGELDALLAAGGAEAERGGGSSPLSPPPPAGSAVRARLAP